MITIGVLALQGAFSKHIEMLISLNVKAIEVRTAEDLEKCDGLIIPGGESTTILRQINFIEIYEKLKEFAITKPVFGTCAGLILMSEKILSSDMPSFGLLDVKVERNAFGRQADSFVSDVQIKLNPKKPATTFPAMFIRAPRIKDCGDLVEILATFEGEPILVRQGHHLGATFHPELTTNTSIHRYFLSLLKKCG
jgi:5'-phosphate synthase pdxT subunit